MRERFSEWLAWMSFGLLSGSLAAAALPRVSEAGNRSDDAPERSQKALAPPAQPAAWRPEVFRAGTAPSLRGGAIITGSTANRLILFTFDDGPNWETTPRLLDSLDARGVKAVFFLTAQRLRGQRFREQQQRAIAQQIVRRGHLVANHTVEHRQLTLMNNDAIAQELDESERIFRSIFGDRPWLFRPPGGARSRRVDAILSGRGYTTILWNLGTGDTQVRAPEEVLKIWKRVHALREKQFGERGGVVLLHDVHAWSIDAFELIYADLMSRNCALLEKGEELYDVLDDPSIFFTPRGTSASEYAPRLRLPSDLLEARQERVRSATARRCGEH